MIAWAKSKNGFTLVELLIVIVIIAILAAITAVAYNGIQGRARDSQRQGDIKTLAKALEMYYIDNNQYPSCSGSGSTTINTSWCTTADGSWALLTSKLVPKYISAMPRDPVSTPNANVETPVGYNYAYFSGSYCGVAPFQVYILVYRFEATAQSDTLDGACTTPTLGPYGAGNSSNYRVTKS